MISLRRLKLEDGSEKEPWPFLTSNFTLLTSRRAFTIVEMVVVVSIVLILVTLILPGLNSLWNQRKLADAENTITGMLMTARAKAMQSGAEGGLFFFVDERNVQRVASITQNPKKAANPATMFTWQNVFVVTTERGFDMPVPMRVVPRSVIYEPAPGGDDEKQRFSDAELANNAVLTPVDDAITRQRNFFSIVYSPNGELIVGRDVLLAENDDNKDMLGDITGLPVGDLSAVTQYYNAKSPVPPTAPLNPPGSMNPYAAVGVAAANPEGMLVADIKNNALNFPSVDGLIVYDDSLFNGAGDATAKRKYLMNYGQPFYVHRLTGAVVRGPVGKNVP